MIMIENHQLVSTLISAFIMIGLVLFWMFAWRIRDLEVKARLLEMRLRHLERQHCYETIERGPGHVEFRSIWGEEAE